MKLRTTLLTAAITLLAAACATSPTGRQQLMLVSEEQAISSSRQAYAQEMGKYKQEGKLVTDPNVLKRVRTITERTAPSSSLSKTATSPESSTANQQTFIECAAG